jgi:hypothetical protein
VATYSSGSHMLVQDGVDNEIGSSLQLTALSLTHTCVTPPGVSHESRVLPALYTSLVDSPASTKSAGHAQIGSATYESPESSVRNSGAGYRCAP